MADNNNVIRELATQLKNNTHGESGERSAMLNASRSFSDSINHTHIVCRGAFVGRSGGSWTHHAKG